MEQIEDFERMRSEPLGRYLPTTVKLMLDGVVENFTGSMLESYLDGAGNPTGNTGIDFIEPDRLREIVVELDQPRILLSFPRHRGRRGAKRVGRRGGGPPRQRLDGNPPHHLPYPGGPSRRHPAISAGSAWSPTHRRSGLRMARTSAC